MRRVGLLLAVLLLNACDGTDDMPEGYGDPDAGDGWVSDYGNCDAYNNGGESCPYNWRTNPGVGCCLKRYVKSVNGAINQHCQEIGNLPTAYYRCCYTTYVDSLGITRCNHTDVNCHPGENPGSDGICGN